MPSKRTGLMPAKKKFTAVGGVGARHIAMQNKISVQAPRVAGAAPAPALAPAIETPLNNLFNIYSFGNIFSGDIIPGYKDKKLDPPHWLALIAASARWSNFLSFHPDGLNVIKTKYKQEFKKDWKGFELIAINYSEPNPNVIARAKALTFAGTNIPYGFRLSINRNMLQNGINVGGVIETFSRENIEHVFAHELGHALGLCATIATEYVVHLPYNYANSQAHINHPVYYSRIGGNMPTGSAGNAINAEQFPQTHFIHNKLIQSATEKLTVSVPSYILLSDDEKHWEQNMVSHEVYIRNETGPERYNKSIKHYSNFYNEIMAPTFRPSYDNLNGYLISNKSLKFLTEMKLNGHHMYVEKSPGASEVELVAKSGTISDRTLTHILKGKAGVNYPATKGIASVEQSLRRDSATVQTHDDTNETITYNVVHAEGYNGDCSNEEIIQLVKNHERIVNDPRFVEFKCCS